MKSNQNFGAECSKEARDGVPLTGQPVAVVLFGFGFRFRIVSKI